MGFPSQKNVFGYGHIRHIAQFLMHNRDSQAHGRCLIWNFNCLAADLYSPAVSPEQAAKYIHQSGFSCSVLSDQYMNLTRFKIEADIGQGRNA